MNVIEAKGLRKTYGRQVALAEGQRQLDRTSIRAFWDHYSALCPNWDREQVPRCQAI